jgi:hypothetical protein
MRVKTRQAAVLMSRSDCKQRFIAPSDEGLQQLRIRQRTAALLADLAQLVDGRR